MSEGNDWTSRVSAVLWRRRWLVMVAALVVTTAAACFVRHVSFDSSIKIWFLDDDPSLKSYDEFLDLFEADEFAAIGVFAPDVFAPDVLATIDSLSRAAKRVPKVRRVRSLTTTRVAEVNEGSLHVGKLVEQLPRTRGQADSVASRALSNKLLKGLMVSADRRATVILVEVTRDANDFASKVELARRLRALIAKHRQSGVTFALAGGPALDAAFYEYNDRDLKTILPLTVGAILVFAFVLTRRFSAMLLPLVVVLLANLWCLGLMGLLGIKMNVLTSALFAFIMAVGVADAMHLVAEFDRLVALGQKRVQAIQNSVEHLLIPCLFTSATTAAGLLSLLISDLRPVRQFGWLAACGVMFAYLLTIAVVPVLLTWARPPRVRARRGASLMDRTLTTLGRAGRPRTVLVVSGVLLLAAVFPLMRLQVGPNTLEYFPEDAPIRTSVAAIEKAVGGSTSVEFLVHTKKDGLKDPQTLRRLDRFQRFIEGIPGISRSVSLVDSLKQLYGLLRDDRVEALPDTREGVAQLLLLLDGEEDLKHLVQSQYSKGRISAQVELTRMVALVKRIPDLHRYAKEHLSGPDLRVEVTGLVNLFYNMEHYLVMSQIKSLSLAFGVVTLMLIVLLRSVRLGLFSMIPNFLPVLLGLALMGAVGIGLDPGTVMIGSVALGLVVDDSVHFLVRLRRAAGRGEPLEQGIRTAMEQTGRPIIFTSLVLAAGWSILVFGTFAPNIHFGTVTAFVILVALVADLVLLPAALKVIQPRIS